MLPDVGFAEFLVVAVVALIVVGPRDLPRLMRQIGGALRQARGMAREFQKSFEDMGREVELDELRQEVEALKRGVMLDDVKDEIAKVNADLKATDRDIRATPAPKSVSKPASKSSETPAATPQATPATTPASAPGQAAALPESAAPDNAPAADGPAPNDAASDDKAGNG